MAYTIEDYAALIPAPNGDKEKLIFWFKGLVQALADAQGLLETLPEAFDVTQAVGPQLDTIGALVGMPRILNYTPGGGQPALMPDDLYRVAIIAKVLKNTWRGTKTEIYDFWRLRLPQYPILIVVNQDMSMSVFIAGVSDTLPSDVSVFAYGPEGSGLLGYGPVSYWAGFPNIVRGMIRNGYFTPEPAGVRVTYSFIDAPVFSYGQNNAYLQGYGAAWLSVS